MQGQLTTALDTMAVVTDKEARTVEALDVDRPWVVAYAVDNLKKIAQFTVAMGGMDSTGKLHIDPERREQLAQITIHGDDFKRLFECEKGNPLRALSQEFLDQLFADVILPACNQYVWGMDDITVEIDGKAAFQYQKPQPGAVSKEDAALPISLRGVSH